MFKPTEKHLKEQTPEVKIEYMLEAFYQNNTTLLNNLIKIFIKEDQLNEFLLHNQKLKNIFIQSLEQLLISTIKENDLTTLKKIVAKMSPENPYEHPIDFYNDIIPMREFSKALANPKHLQFLERIRKKHIIDDQYLLFLAIKTHQLELLIQLHKLGIDFSQTSIPSTLIQAITHDPNIKNKQELLQFLISIGLEPNDAIFHLTPNYKK